MQKLVQLYKLAALNLIAIFVVSCSDTTNLVETSYPSYTIPYSDPIRYLNSIRVSSGISTLNKNTTLDVSSLNHAKYTVANDSDSHFETAGELNFTGVKPTDRAFFAGYNSPVSENIAINSPDSVSSISSLMSAIYHRFGFLDTTINEIGWAEFESDKGGKNIVYNMGNSYLESFCSNGVSDNGYGKFYGGFCKDKTVKISEPKFKTYKNIDKVEYVYYPNKDPFKAFFSHEIPDPMPECKITANPVSIEFGKDESSVDLKSFKIYENGTWLTNSKILTASSDPNRQLNDKQFALFILEPFKFDTEYEARLSYFQDGKDKELSWKFKTMSPSSPYFTVKGGESLAIKPDEWYEIFFYPDNCNDVFSKYSMSYRFMSKPEILSIDTNTLKVRLSGVKGSKLSLKTDSGKEVNLVLTSSSANANLFDFKLIVVVAFILFLAIIIILKSRS